jgi:histidinol-phosphate/aromatic aminotransferase/cobyric acid decarboxylase-like protein
MARIGSNEYWEGPVPDAVAAVREVTPHCNYYDPDGECDALIKLVASMEKVPVDHVVPWAGSTSPLVRSVLGMCSPERGLVTANPTFEVAWTTAEYMGCRWSRCRCVRPTRRTMCARWSRPIRKPGCSTSATPTIRPVR